jgi:hypothetical protein
VANDASGGIASASTLRLELVDAWGEPVTHLADLPVPKLAPGEACTLASAVALPAVLPPGAYAVRALADAHGVVAERDEANNARAAGIAIVEGGRDRE